MIRLPIIHQSQTILYPTLKLILPILDQFHFAYSDEITAHLNHPMMVLLGTILLIICSFTSYFTVKTIHIRHILKLI